ncbi:hypothetical protein KVR01_009000 [Diaporthe batatas]|uniref:uncharacterized protein n=1 Tax=Diaporthe batatas TaxID=748121 RepID=UPI001D04331B|nr:uncharacterized protein KVR01_009000 [Diaporthe batatas]KAG8160736.1 hypothetical protein KVR01_009000 [Diaporthe batatas]
MADTFERRHRAFGNRARSGHENAPEDGPCTQLHSQEEPIRVNTSSGTIDVSETDAGISVKQRLEDSFRQSKARNEEARNGSNSFLPRKALTAILTDQTIQTLLTDQVCLDDITGDKGRIKIFAILLLMGKTKHIRRIIQHGITDDDLPLEWDRIHACFSKDAALAKAFLFSQYDVHVPVWDFSSHEIREKTYDWNQKLPFLRKESLSRGGQGVVWKIEIHRDHYQTKTQSNRWECLHKGPEFALKEFINKADFKDELEALKLFSRDDSKHANLIKALAAYTHCGKHFLIFPLAEGNLEKFWQDAGPLLRDPLWLISQCHGLTDGLEKVHRYRFKDSSRKHKRLLGRHGDIKPENVLWFKNHSTGKDRLVLSDFTLMRFHAEGSNEATTIGRIGGTRTYRAPEVTFMSGKRVSQKYDVWSLGCVFLVFISCHLVGYDATRKEYFRGDDGRDYQSFDTVRFMEDFIELGAREDKYFLYKPGLQEAEVKSSVRQWFAYLHGQRHCSDALHEFLDIIQERMLLPRPETRSSIQSVRKRLAGILDKSRYQGRATDFCRAGRPRAVTRSNSFPPLWDHDEYEKRRCYKDNDTQLSTRSDMTSSELSGGSTDCLDTGRLEDAVGSRHDFEQIKNLFKDIASSQSSNSEHTPPLVVTTSSILPRDGDVLRNSPGPRSDHHESPSKAGVDDFRQHISLSRGFSRVADHSGHLSPPTINKGASYTALISINGDLKFPHHSAGMGLVATPETSQYPASSDAHSLCTATEDPRPSMSSRTDESILRMEEYYEQAHQSEDLHSAAMKRMPDLNPKSPATLSLGDGTQELVDGAEGADSRPGAEPTEKRSWSRDGLSSLRKNLRSLPRRALEHIRRGGRRRVEREGS